jgi:hypothetical protein|tara:strand:+ start:6389 stop:6856 length:468 start_codon:yes stop_codon:yes gene_type:complete
MAYEGRSNDAINDLIPQFQDQYSNHNLPALAKEMVRLKAELDEATAVKTALQKEFDYLRIRLVPDKMIDFGTTSMNIKGIGRLTISGDMWAGVQKGMTLKMHSWLREHGAEDLIKDSVNPSTMKAFIKEQHAAGVNLPLELFRIDAFTRASVTKK